VKDKDPQLFYETLSHLKILRDKLREFQKTQDDALMLNDLIAFVDMYEEAEEKLINTSPYNQDADAVQIMTVFKAKGLEYKHVFLVSCMDEIWGSTSRGNSNRLTLPPNLAPIRHAGASDDERLRILFVALTRAKYGLYMTSYRHTYTGKSTKRLAYFDEQEQDDGTFQAMILPSDARLVVSDQSSVPPIEHLELDWRTRHTAGITVTNLRGLLEDRLRSYKLSPTHLNSFIDLEYSGPEAFFYKTILKFPEAPTLSNQFGNAMHGTMEWIQQRVDETSSKPPVEDAILEFSRQLKKQKLPKLQEALEQERGEKALIVYLAQRADIFKPGDKAEFPFSHENVFLGDVHMSGKIDRMEIDKDKKEIVVVDYKTGKAYDKWERDTKLHKYEQQLYCYKLLIENSRTFKGYTVSEGRLEFLEPDENGVIQHIALPFKEEKLNETKKLITAVWKHIHELDFPDVSDYEATLKGIEQFERDLLTKIK
jgi:DNA helicase-2/ATP-dependent DNA helicase PcrA